MTTTSRGTAALLVVLAAICFGTTGTAQALGAAGVDPVLLGSARIVVGGALLAAVLGVQALAARRRAGAHPTGARPTFSRPASARIRHSGPPSVVVLALGAVGVAAYQPAFFTGTSENGVALGTIVALGCAPVITGALEWLLLRRVPSRRWFASTALAVVGVVVLSGVFSFPSDSAVPPEAAAPVQAGAPTALGFAGSLGAAAAYALYAVCSKMLLERRWSPAAAMGSQFGAAALLLLPVLLVSGPRGLADAVPAVLWLGVVTVALAYTLFARGLRSLPAAQVSTLTLVEPATATLLGVLVLREVLTADALVGVVVLLVAVAVLVVPGRRAAAEVG